MAFYSFVFVPQRRPKDGEGFKVNEDYLYGRTIVQRRVGRLSRGELYVWPCNQWQIDIIKENISHYCEAVFADLSQEKEDRKRQMKQCLEVDRQGVC